MGPKKRNDAQGLPISEIPVLALFIAETTPPTASFWPITSLLSLESNLSKAVFSLLPKVLSGIPVQLETTILISSTLTSLLFSLLLFSLLVSNLLIFLPRDSSLFLYFSAISILPCKIYSFFAFWIPLNLDIKDEILSYSPSTLSLLVALASSSKSIALSGKYLSLIYLSERVTANLTASSLILIL